MNVTLRREDCEAAVNKFINSSKFILKEYNVKPFSEKTLGFMGRHFKLTASVLHGGKIHDLKFFAKLAPTSEAHRSLVIDYKFFSKEIVAYSNLVPELNASLPSGITLPVPRCYFTRDTNMREKVPVPGSDEEELIILEDLTYRGYSLLENAPVLDLPHCLAILKTMAKFHGASILLEQSYKKSHPHADASKEIFSCAKESFLVHEKGHFGYEWSRYSAESLATAVTKLWPNRFEGQREVILSRLLEAWRRVFDMVRPSSKYMSVLCHGDTWTNNMLIAYKNNSNGERIPEDVLFVDLQLVRYVPPILDILLFLYVCTRRNFRDQHLEELLQYYHSCLKDIVSPDLLEKIFPFSSLLESCEELRDFGRVMSTGYIPIILEENDPNLALDKKQTESFDYEALFFRDRGDVIANNCRKSENYGERVEENYRECLEGLGLWKK